MVFEIKLKFLSTEGYQQEQKCQEKDKVKKEKL